MHYHEVAMRPSGPHVAAWLSLQHVAEPEVKVNVGVLRYGSKEVRNFCRRVFETLTRSTRGFRVGHMWRRSDPCNTFRSRTSRCTLLCCTQTVSEDKPYKSHDSHQVVVVPVASQKACKSLHTVGPAVVKEHTALEEAIEYPETLRNDRR